MITEGEKGEEARKRPWLVGKEREPRTDLQKKSQNNKNALLVVVWNM